MSVSLALLSKAPKSRTMIRLPSHVTDHVGFHRLEACHFGSNQLSLALA
jgi:hypothetical protein